jgi:hypothetical protein
MNPYTVLASTTDEASLCARLTAWHDAMVAHERRLRSRVTAETCDDECPHAEAPALWAEALAVFGEKAEELTFLRSRAVGAGRSVDHGRVGAGAGYGGHRGPGS